MGVLTTAKARQRVLRGQAGCAVALVGWARTFLTSCRPKILFTVHVESALITHKQARHSRKRWKRDLEPECRCLAARDGYSLQS